MIVPAVETGKPRDLQGFPGTSGDGGNRTRARFPPSVDGLRNCRLVLPTERTHTRVPLPLVRLPFDWHEDDWIDVRGRRRAPCTVPGYRKGCKPANAGKSYPASPPSREEGYLILDELCPPGFNDRKHGPIRLRNRALVATGLGSGLRIHELLLLTPVHVDFDRNLVTVERGKGGKRRMSAITHEALAELNAWLHIRSMLGFGLEEPIFCVLEGKTRGGRMSQPYVRSKLHEATRRAGIGKRVTPHQLRHFHAVFLDSKNTPIGLIQRQLGHSSPATTGKYLAGISAADVAGAVTGAFL